MSVVNNNKKNTDSLLRRCSVKAAKIRPINIRLRIGDQA